MKLSQTRYARQVGPSHRPGQQRTPRTAPKAAVRRINVGKTVGSFVPRLAQKAFEGYGFSTVALLTDWAAIVGHEVAGYTVPEQLKWPRQRPAESDPEPVRASEQPAATLTLRVEPARALDVQYGAAAIIDRINSYFGYRAIGELRVMQVPLDIGRPGLPKTRRAAPVQPHAEHTRADNHQIAAISDERLRRSLERLQAGLGSA